RCERSSQATAGEFASKKLDGDPNFWISHKEPPCVDDPRSKFLDFASEFIQPGDERAWSKRHRRRLNG
ncbi:MAG: hypothetical protein C4334_14640, partial [Pyrinomonas sp.]